MSFLGEYKNVLTVFPKTSNVGPLVFRTICLLPITDGKVLKKNFQTEKMMYAATQRKLEKKNYKIDKTVP